MILKISKLKETINKAKKDNVNSLIIKKWDYSDNIQELIQELIKLGYEPRYDLALILKECPNLLQIYEYKIYISLKDKFIDITGNYIPRDFRAGQHFPRILNL